MIRSWSTRKQIGTPVKRRAKEQFASEGKSDYFGFPTIYPYVLARLKNKNEIVYALSSKVVTDFSHLTPDARWKLTSGLNTNQLLPPDVPSGKSQFNEPGADSIWYQLDDNGVWFARGGRSVRSDQSNSYWVGLWGKGKRRPYRIYEGQHKWVVEMVTVSRDGRRVASADKFGQIHVWDANSGRQIRVFDSARHSQLWNVQWNNSGTGVHFATKPYSTKEYGRNHYGRCNKFFDLHRRYVADEKAPDNNQQIKPQGDDLETLVIKGDGITAVFDDPAFGIPSAQEFLRGPISGLQNLVALGSESGKIVIVELMSNNRSRIRRWFHGHHSTVTSIDQSPDGKLLASSSIDGTIRFWSLEDLDRFSGDIDFKFRGNQVLEFAQDSETARVGIELTDTIIGFGDVSFYESRKHQIENKYKPGQSLEFRMNRRNGAYYAVDYELQPSATHVEPLASLLITKDSIKTKEVAEWVIWSPRGFYDASDNGDQMIGWHMNPPDRYSNAKFFKASQFSKELYRPAIIDRIFEKKDTALALDSVIEEDVEVTPDYRNTSRLEQMAPPSIEIVSPKKDGKVFGSGRLKVMAKVTPNSDAKITDVVFEVNGFRTVGKGLGLRSSRRKQSERVLETVELTPGENRISVTAFTKDSQSAPAITTVIYNPKKQVKKAENTLYVISIGISDYEDDEIRDLSYADKDARDFARICAGQEGLLFDVVDVELLVNEEATKDNILDALDDLLIEKKPGRHDCVMILYSGHGVFDSSNQYYFTTHDTVPGRFRRSAIAQETIEKICNAQLAHCRRILFMDACHSGATMSSGIRSSDPWHDCGGIVFTSSTWREASLELADAENGVLVEALLEAATIPNRGVDHALSVVKDGVVTAKELDFYFYNRITQLTDGRQHASSEWPGNLIDFPVFHRIEEAEE